jgi:ABC-type branched-subunit amino acid transport system substrate-binding protein
MARQYYDMKIPMPILYSSGGAEADWDWWKTTEGKGRWWVCVAWIGFPPPKDLPRAPEFIENYRKRWGHYPLCTGNSYDTIYSLKAAVEKAKSFDTDKVISALETLKEDKLPATTFPALGWWDENHNTQFPWYSRYMAQWQGPEKLPIVYPFETASSEWLLKAPYEN